MPYYIGMAIPLKPTDCVAEVAPDTSAHDLLILHGESCYEGDDYEEIFVRILGHFKYDEAQLEILGSIMDDYATECMMQAYS